MTAQARRLRPPCDTSRGVAAGESSAVRCWLLSARIPPSRVTSGSGRPARARASRACRSCSRRDTGLHPSEPAVHAPGLAPTGWSWTEPVQPRRTRTGTARVGESRSGAPGGYKPIADFRQPGRAGTASRTLHRCRDRLHPAVRAAAVPLTPPQRRVRPSPAADRRQPAQKLRHLPMLDVVQPVRLGQQPGPFVLVPGHLQHAGLARPARPVR